MPLKKATTVNSSRVASPELLTGLLAKEDPETLDFLNAFGDGIFINKIITNEILVCENMRYIKVKYIVNEVDPSTFQVVNNETNSEICICNSYEGETATSKFRAEFLAKLLNEKSSKK